MKIDYLYVNYQKQNLQHNEKLYPTFALIYLNSLLEVDAH